MTPSTHPLFWRDDAIPHVELRQVLDGREVSYAPHFHKEWSIGAILDGHSEFICADRLHYVERGTLVMMDPDVVHACNPKQDSPWAYYMMHINKDWLASLLLNEAVRSNVQWQDTRLDTLVTANFYQEFVTLCTHLMSAKFSSSEKDKMLKNYLVNLFSHLDNAVKESEVALPLNDLYKVANYLNQYCLEDTSIEFISSKFGLSTGYFIRAFKRQFNMTPHAYRLNCRVQLGQQALKAGKTISEVAHAIGFSDQAHFQRAFKQRVAATPNQYSRSVG
jgi:AraC-like DNA-binding protein